VSDWSVIWSFIQLELSITDIAMLLFTFVPTIIEIRRYQKENARVMLAYIDEIKQSGDKLVIQYRVYNKANYSKFFVLVIGLLPLLVERTTDIKIEANEARNFSRSFSLDMLEGKKAMPIHIWLEELGERFYISLKPVIAVIKKNEQGNYEGEIL